jgi:hypothetical protein
LNLFFAIGGKEQDSWHTQTRPEEFKGRKVMTEQIRIPLVRTFLLSTASASAQIPPVAVMVVFALLASAPQL